jgi:hypothetical protein
MSDTMLGNDINIHIRQTGDDALITEVIVNEQRKTIEPNLSLSGLIDDNAIKTASDLLKNAINSKPETPIVEPIVPPIPSVEPDNTIMAETTQVQADNLAKEMTLNKTITLKNKEGGNTIYEGSIRDLLTQLAGITTGSRNYKQKKDLQNYIERGLDGWADKSEADISKVIDDYRRTQNRDKRVAFFNNKIFGGAYNTRKNVRRGISSTRKGYYVNKPRRTHRMNTTNHRVTRRRRNN